MQGNLRQAYANPHNYEAMLNMTWAQYIAAQAFSSSLLGILHSLSHAVCAYYDIHHGLNNGVGISRVWSYNQPAAMDRYADIAGAMGVDTRTMSTVAAADAAIDEVIRLARDVGIPDNFSSAGPYPKSRMGKGWYEKRPDHVASDDGELQKMAEHMMADLCTPGNPRDLTVEAAKEMLRDCVYDVNERKTGAPAHDGQPTHRGHNGTEPQNSATRTEAIAAGG